MKTPIFFHSSFIGILVCGLLLSRADALPSFARQDGMSCIGCHTEFPILNEHGRAFKLTGYTNSSGGSEYPPLAVMLMPSFTQTQKSQAGGAAPHFGKNSNIALTQASLFYAGRLFGPYADSLFGDCPEVAGFMNKIGVFMQATYDGVARQIVWDNVEIRYADSGTVLDHDVIYGFYVNNNPSLQDPWNTAPAWTFPFSGSGLAPTPSAGTLIEGGLSQQVIGAGAYVLIANHVYLDIAGYHTLDDSFQRAVGVSPDGENKISGIAPYWRLAYTQAVGNQSWEIGLFGLAASTYPDRVSSAGHDHFLDQGVDAQYQVAFGKHDVTGLFSSVYEREDWQASETLGNTSNRRDHLWSTRVTLDYLYDKTYGAAAGYFWLDGSSDATLYADSPNGSPTSDGFVLQLNYLPFNKGTGPSFWPKSNVKLSIQYVIYNRFNGTSQAAGDNNTLYLESWIAF